MMVIALGTASIATAQPRRNIPSRANQQKLEVRGFADLGLTFFTANESFKAVTGSSNGFVFGGGAGVILPQKIFADVHASRFKKDGTRVIVVDGKVFDLGIKNTITITPVEITAGYRFGTQRDTLRPYAGGGISWYRYSETDEFATSSEQTMQSYTGFHLLAGAEYRVHRFFGVAGEAAWARVPNALGQQPTSVGSAFDEDDLGGATIRVKLVIGR